MFDSLNGGKYMRVKSLHDFIPVVREVHLDIGTHVERFQRHPVIGLKICQERQRPNCARCR